MTPLDQRLEILVDRARKAVLPHDMRPSVGFAARVLSRVRREPDAASIWLKFSLASLPVAATVMIACLFWFGMDLPRDLDQLANSFIHTPVLP
jgi:hypothetical protein